MGSSTCHGDVACDKSLPLSWLWGAAQKFRKEGLWTGGRRPDKSVIHTTLAITLSIPRLDCVIYSYPYPTEILCVLVWILGDCYPAAGLVVGIMVLSSTKEHTCNRYWCCKSHVWQLFSISQGVWTFGLKRYSSAGVQFVLMWDLHMADCKCNTNRHQIVNYFFTPEVTNFRLLEYQTATTLSWTNLSYTIPFLQVMPKYFDLLPCLIVDF